MAISPLYEKKVIIAVKITVGPLFVETMKPYDHAKSFRPVFKEYYRSPFFMTTHD